MSMEHKAFLFEYEDFALELKPILEIALDLNENKDLEKYINDNLYFLKDPDEGKPLSKNWQKIFDLKDIHDYGDFALTKFYDPNDDIGLGYVGHDWVEIEETILSLDINTPILILGEPIGKEGNYFDPGKMGSYFQSLDVAIESKNVIDILIKGNSIDRKYLNPVISILDLAIASNKGLYITF
jgi:hypothetical protein